MIRAWCDFLQISGIFGFSVQTLNTHHIGKDLKDQAIVFCAQKNRPTVGKTAFCECRLAGMRVPTHSKFKKYTT
ncbi:hypothetical protein [Candidatus Enterovibrio escicola]|uniref:hypothetical protein n=1 Tax=Candidatus Enterovibrio escicola TaxID=1927127 RepID=UPI001237B9AB|nr:hypothetical protein [Candidatus Enterovibrio escacola]